MIIDVRLNKTTILDLALFQHEMNSMLTNSQKEINITHLNIHHSKLKMFENLPMQPVIALQANMLLLHIMI